MMCTTVLHGGVYHRTSTPHKSGNTMKEKKNVIVLLLFCFNEFNLNIAKVAYLFPLIIICIL